MGGCHLPVMGNTGDSVRAERNPSIRHHTRSSRSTRPQTPWQHPPPHSPPNQDHHANPSPEQDLGGGRGAGSGSCQEATRAAGVTQDPADGLYPLPQTTCTPSPRRSVPPGASRQSAHRPLDGLYPRRRSVPPLPDGLHTLRQACCKMFCF